MDFGAPCRRVHINSRTWAFPRYGNTEGSLSSLPCRDLRRETERLPRPNLLSPPGTHVGLPCLSWHSARIVSRFHVCGVISNNQGGKDIQERGVREENSVSVSRPSLEGDALSCATRVPPQANAASPRMPVQHLKGRKV